MLTTTIIRLRLVVPRLRNFHVLVHRFFGCSKGPPFRSLWFNDCNFCKLNRVSGGTRLHIRLIEARNDDVRCCSHSVYNYIVLLIMDVGQRSVGNGAFSLSRLLPRWKFRGAVKDIELILLKFEEVIVDKEWFESASDASYLIFSFGASSVFCFLFCMTKFCMVLLYKICTRLPVLIDLERTKICLHALDQFFYDFEFVVFKLNIITLIIKVHNKFSNFVSLSKIIKHYCYISSDVRSRFYVWQGTVRTIIFFGQVSCHYFNQLVNYLRSCILLLFINSIY